eukprot:IDg17230t1
MRPAAPIPAAPGAATAIPHYTHRSAGWCVGAHFRRAQRVAERAGADWPRGGARLRRARAGARKSPPSRCVSRLAARSTPGRKREPAIRRRRAACGAAALGTPEHTRAVATLVRACHLAPRVGGGG